MFTTGVPNPQSVAHCWHVAFAQLGHKDRSPIPRMHSPPCTHSPPTCMHMCVLLTRKHTTLTYACGPFTHERTTPTHEGVPWPLCTWTLPRQPVRGLEKVEDHWFTTPTAAVKMVYRIPSCGHYHSHFSKSSPDLVMLRAKSSKSAGLKLIIFKFNFIN